MKPLLTLTTALVLTVSGALMPQMALAQQGNPGAHFIEQWDMDGNGEVTLAEAQEKRGDVFVMFDANENDQMDAPEWQAIADHLAGEAANSNAAGMKRGPGKAIHDAMEAAFNDTDGNGIVTKDEFVAATAGLFATIDRTGDGLMTTADFARP